MYSPPPCFIAPLHMEGWRSHGVARYCMPTLSPANSSVRMKPTRSSQRRTPGARLTNTRIARARDFRLPADALTRLARHSVRERRRSDAVVATLLRALERNGGHSRRRQ